MQSANSSDIPLPQPLPQDARPMSLHLAPSSFFTLPDDGRMRYARFTPAGTPRGVVWVVPGRREFIEKKYAELGAELLAKDFHHCRTAQPGAFLALFIRRRRPARSCHGFCYPAVGSASFLCGCRSTKSYSPPDRAWTFFRGAFAFTLAGRG